MEKHTQAKWPQTFWLNSAKLATIFLVAFFIYSFTTIKSTLRIHKVKGGVEVEFAHTPSTSGRELYLEGISPVFYSNSGTQLEGENCAILHRVKWRVPEVGVLVVGASIYDSMGKRIEFIERRIIMGPDPEGE